MITCYKVVRYTIGTQSRVSAIAHGFAQITYTPNEITYANPIMLEAGYGIFVFEHLHQAREYIDLSSPPGIMEIWKCEAEKFIPFKEHVLFDLNLLHFGIMTEAPGYQIKPGTNMVESIKLIEEIR